MDRFPLKLFFFQALAILSCVASSAQAPLHDVSNRISLKEKFMVGGFNDASLDGFTSGPSVEIALSDVSELWGSPHEGKGAMIVKPASGLPASEWRTVSKTFDKPRNLSRYTAVEFGILTQEGPAVDQWVRLRLLSGRKSFDCMAQIIPTLWRTVIFDVSGCKFLGKVTGIEIGLMSPTDSPWEGGRYFILDGLCFGKPLDLNFMTPASVDGFTCRGGKVFWDDDALVCKFARGSVLRFPDLSGSRNMMYNPPLGSDLEQRNTVFMVLENKSDVSRVRLSWKTIQGREGSKDFDIEPHSGAKACYFNISDSPECKGNLATLSLEPLDGKGGKWIIGQVRFELEHRIFERAGEILSCTADASRLRIRGTVDPSFIKDYPLLAVYEYPFMKDGAPIGKLNLLYEAPATETFDIQEIANSRLGGRMTHLSSRFLAVVKDSEGNCKWVGDPFYVENWRDFTENPYSFTLPDRKFPVTRYGAKGDGFTDDTKAIQKAIDACSRAGGGQVVFPADGSEYGTRYVATNIILRSNVDLHIEKGAVLWQSYDLRDYGYVPAYGHDFDIPGCPWTHCLFINYPLIQGNDVSHVKITGPGTIRMADPYSSNPDWSHYAKYCSDRIHICPVGISNSSWIEFTDIDEVRSNNYHTNFHGNEFMFIGNVKLYDVQCVSGDGFSFGQGCRHVRVERVFFDSNDDGIVLSSSYKDPRGKISPWRHDDDDADHSVRDIKVEHSYINSSKKGAGKAIALIPWGSTNPEQWKQELDSIQVYDCVLAGGHSVGTWCDNPFDGKPFDNMEENDYAPVKNFRILGNEYLSKCELLSVKPATFVTDCGLHGTDTFLNENFLHRSAYWTMEGNAGAEVGFATAAAGGSVWQGLYLKKGTYVFFAEVCGDGRLFASDILEGTDVGVKEFSVGGNDWESVLLQVRVPADGDYGFGVRAGKEVKVRRCKLFQEDGKK